MSEREWQKPLSPEATEWLKRQFDSLQRRLGRFEARAVVKRHRKQWWER